MDEPQIRIFMGYVHIEDNRQRRDWCEKEAINAQDGKPWLGSPASRCGAVAPDSAGGKSVNIAIVGWGSLIWCPGSIRLVSRWHKTGPELPIEFSRVSRDGRLTLVITPDVATVPTLWALSACDELDRSADNLCEREGTSNGNIGRVSLVDPDGGDAITQVIHDWLLGQSLDGAVWTALPPKRTDGSEKPMNDRDAVHYIRSLSGDVLCRAEEYVRNTPEQIDTPIRRRLRDEFGWVNRPLSGNLFEEG